MMFKITYPRIIISGLQREQEYIPVHVGTAVFAIADHLQLQGPQDVPAVVEVRDVPAITLQLSKPTLARDDNLD